MPEDWRAATDSAAVLLYLTNSPRLREPTFRRILSAARALPDFAAAWDKVIAHPPSVFSRGATMRMQTIFMDQPIVELNTLIPITAGLEVSIVVGVPVDDAARYAYAHIGCEVEGTRWEMMLKEFSAV